MATSRTPTSGQPIAAGGDQLAQLMELLPALFGTKQTTTSNSGDTTALQQLIGQLQGADYSKTLEAIFQQAGGQIPGLQAAFSNAVGARSGNNSAVQAALSQLLQQTTLAGQKQVADQQLQNQQLQATAGSSIAQATKGTTQTQSTKGAAPQLAGVLGLIQAAKMATGAKDLDELGRKFGLGGNRTAGTTSPVTSAGPAMPAAAIMSGYGDATMPGAMSSNGAITSVDNSAFLDSLAPFLTGGSNPVAGDAFMPGTGGRDFGALPFDLGGGNVAGDAYLPGNIGSGGFGGGLGPEFDQFLIGGGDFDPGYIDPGSWY